MCVYFLENWVLHKIEHGIFLTCSIQWNPSFQNIQSGLNKNSVKMKGFKHFFRKQAISIFFVANGLDMALFDNETHFLQFYQTMLIKNVF